jgi:hypothetical protein
MKKILPIVFGIQMSAFAQSQAVIGLPEYKFLYANYNNKLECTMSDADSTYIWIPSDQASVTPSSYTYGFNENSCFDVRVLPNVKRVEVEVHAIKNEQDFIVLKEMYAVKAIPSARIYGTTFSRTTGYKAVVGFGPDCPLTNVKFTVLGGIIFSGNNSYSFAESFIPSTIFPELKPGTKISIELMYRIDGQSSVNKTSSILTIVP